MMFSAFINDADKILLDTTKNVYDRFYLNVLLSLAIYSDYCIIKTYYYNIKKLCKIVDS